MIVGDRVTLVSEIWKVSKGELMLVEQEHLRAAPSSVARPVWVYLNSHCGSLDSFLPQQIVSGLFSVYIGQ
jgi:hypothetical protein